HGEIDRCDVLVRNNSGDDNADVEVNLDSDRDSRRALRRVPGGDSGWGASPCEESRAGVEER
ncbi:hypothetical protein AB0H18_22485, partial [Streptomyces sp. NPDC020766]|uniref:hypothetical protein n=1 Tax=Streptomyces sp. NPDC020766 TaxID=3155011 RepID=UPI0033E84963